MVLNEIQAYLVADGLSLVSGTNLFRGLMPDTIVQTTAIFEYPGLPNEPATGGKSVRLEYPRVQVMVRGADRDDYDTPRLLLNQIIGSLAKIADEQLSGVQYLEVVALGTPSAWHDENQRVCVVCNFQVIKEPSVS